MIKLSEETYQRIVELYQTKQYTQKEISELCNCSVDTVSRQLIKAGLKESKLSKKLQDIYNNVIEDFNNGMYCKDLALKYNVDEHSIYKILDKAKIKRQTGYHSKCNIDYFKHIDTPNKSYLLGFITADGAVVNNILSIEVHKKDKDVLDFAKSEINPEATLTPTRNCYKVTFGAKQIGKDLAQYGVVQNKSKTITTVPINLIPENLLHFYFRGLIDGDGCIGNNGRLSIYSGSEKFIEDVQNILCKKANLTKLKVYHGATYFISWGSQKDKQKLFNYIYQDLDKTFYYKRKYQRLYENAIQANTEVT